MLYLLFAFVVTSSYVDLTHVSLQSKQKIKNVFLKKLIFTPNINCRGPNGHLVCGIKVE